MRPALAALLGLLALSARASDPYSRFATVLDLFDDTLALAGPGPMGAGSLERTLEGRDSLGRLCQATIDLRGPSLERRGAEHGLPADAKILIVQLAVRREGDSFASYAGSALFWPSLRRESDGTPSRRPLMRPVSTEIGPDRVIHEETDGDMTRSTRLDFRDGRLYELRQRQSRRGGESESFDCTGLHG